MTPIRGGQKEKSIDPLSQLQAKQFSPILLSFLLFLISFLEKESKSLSFWIETFSERKSLASSNWSYNFKKPEQ